MIKIIKLLLFLVVFCTFHNAHGQRKLNHISGDNGLSQNTIKSLIQDRNGFIWIGNYHGIDKYDGYNMEHYVFSKDDSGLSSNLIHGLFEDKDGYIWAGTSDAGINRLNPRTGKVDKFFSTGVKSGNFRNIYNFFQSSSGVIFYFVPNELRFLKVSEDGDLIFDKSIESLGKINKPIRSIVPSINGKHWMLTTSKIFLLNIDETNNKVNVTLNKTGIDDLFEEGFAVNMVEAKENVFWILSSNLELLKLQINNKLEVISKEYIDLKNNQFTIGNRSLTSFHLAIDKNEKLWIAGDRLLLNHDTNSGKTTFLNNNNNYQINHKFFQTLLIDNFNILWLGTRYNGLFKIDLDNFTFLNSHEFLGVSQQRNKKFNKYPLSAISEDKSGNIWLGAQGNGGMAILNKEDIDQAILNTSNKPWSFNYLSNFKDFQDTRLTNIRRFLHDSKDNLWVGSSKGFSLIQKAKTKSGYKVQFFDEVIKHRESLISLPVFAIEEDRRNNIWIGLWGGGLVKLTFNEKSQEYEVSNFMSDPNSDMSISDNFVRDLYEDKDGTLWVGTVSGLNKIVELNNGSIKFIRYLNDENNENSLSNNHVMDIFQGKNEKLYVGTFGGGLNEIDLNPENKLEFRHLTVEDGLPSNVIYQINEDNEGNIWILHVREISKIDSSTSEISYFDKQDGFEIDEFKDNAMLLTSDGLMLCGGVGGFTFFNPNNLSVNENSPQLNIIDFKLFDESIHPNQIIDGYKILDKGINETSKIELPHHLNSMEFDFSSVHFSNPAKNQYKFILEGFEEKWQFSKGNERRFASYTNIPPGDYVFKVLASNSAGIWTIEPKEIAIRINKPWYFTTVSLFGFTIVSLAVIYLLVRIRLRQVRLESQLELDAALHAKTDEINRMKLQFFTNISHELRTPLTLIIGPLQQIMQGKTDPEYAKKLNSIMHRNSVRLLKLINQLLDFRKAESGNLKLLVQKDNLVEFISDIYNVFEEIALEKDIKFVFVTEFKELDAWFDQDKLEKILYNLLSNAFKFTPRGKSIKIELQVEQKEEVPFAFIQVIDYGMGIPKSELKSIFERFYQTKKENNSIHIGSGLGLAYTKHLSEIHHGHMKIESKLHYGTTCSFSFPINVESYSKESIVESQFQQYDFKFTKKEVSDIKQVEISNSNIEETKTHNEETPTVLIVEDNTELRNYLSNYFGETYVVLSAENGEEGLDLATNHSPNLIISDLMMPKMDGIEMCKKIKSDIRTSHIPVIILTAKAGLENEKEGLETGADEFVLKPFSTELLKLRVENILRTKQLWVKKYQGSTNIKSFKGLSNKLDQEFLNRCVKIIKSNIDNPDFSVEQFTSEVAMSRSALFKKIKSITGQSTSEFIRSIRLKRAVKHLKTGKYSITEVVFMVGFSDPKYFRTCFKKQFGKTPSEFIRPFKQQH